MELRSVFYGSNKAPHTLRLQTSEIPNTIKNGLELHKVLMQCIFLCFGRLRMVTHLLTASEKALVSNFSTRPCLKCMQATKFLFSCCKIFAPIFKSADCRSVWAAACGVGTKICCCISNFYLHWQARFKLSEELFRINGENSNRSNSILQNFSKVSLEASHPFRRDIEI